MENKKIYTVSQSLSERNRLRSFIETFVSGRSLVPPLSMEQLSALGGEVVALTSLDPSFLGWVMVELHNQVWKETVASVPAHKRLLLLPKCLSNSTGCSAEVDDLGLLCNRCSRCSIPNLQDKAEDLGMMSLVAEGFTTVVGLIREKVVDAVIGVGCLESLEKAFPLLTDHAVPALAIPLNDSGCKDTTVDIGYVNRMLELHSDAKWMPLDEEALKNTINRWFSAANLEQRLSPVMEQTSRITLDWLGGDGKRWRPFLLAATWQVLKGDDPLPEEVELAALAVECFHKASLVHDDIQDNDMERYGRQTVNSAHGVPMAINVGDLLLGEGYRILASTGCMELLGVAATAHVALCKGQGMELEWSRSPRPLTMDFVIRIFCHKTVPAFEVALLMGLICVGADNTLHRALSNYARALGIAYQLLDDMEDFETDQPVELRPSAVLAALCEQSAHRPEFVSALLGTDNLKAFLALPGHDSLLQAALARVAEMVDCYRKETLDALQELPQVELKRLLFRVAKKILKYESQTPDQK